MSDTVRVLRYATLAIAVIVLLSLLVPAVDALSAFGYFRQKTYALALQDNSELRNTGGFLACMGYVDVQNGEVNNLRLYYNYSANQFTNTSSRDNIKVDGPESFTRFFNTEYVKLSDMNVQRDFATFAPLFASAFEGVTGQHVDGVIALDFTALQQILKLTGPITVTGEVVTWRNVIDRVHYYSATATGAFKASLVAFLTELGNNLINAIRTENPVRQLLFLRTVQDLAQQRHVLLYADGLPLKGYDGAITSTGGDFLSVVDANYAGLKSDLNVDRTITYHTQILENGSLTSQLTLSYTNKCWWNYTVFTTALVPKDAQLLTSKSNALAFRGPLVTRDEQFTTFSSFLNVAPHATMNVTYTYALPNVVNAAGAFPHYDLLVQKQAGVDRYTLNTDVRLPPGAKLVHGSNVVDGLIANDDVQLQVIYR